MLREALAQEIPRAGLIIDDQNSQVNTHAVIRRREA